MQCPSNYCSGIVVYALLTRHCITSSDQRKPNPQASLAFSSTVFIGFGDVPQTYISSHRSMRYEHKVARLQRSSINESASVCGSLLGEISRFAVFKSRDAPDGNGNRDCLPSQIHQLAAICFLQSCLRTSYMTPHSAHAILLFNCPRFTALTGRPAHKIIACTPPGRIVKISAWRWSSLTECKGCSNAASELENRVHGHGLLSLMNFPYRSGLRYAMETTRVFAFCSGSSFCSF